MDWPYSLTCFSPRQQPTYSIHNFGVCKSHFRNPCSAISYPLLLRLFGFFFSLRILPHSRNIAEAIWSLIQVPSGPFRFPCYQWMTCIRTYLQLGRTNTGMNLQLSHHIQWLQWQRPWNLPSWVLPLTCGKFHLGHYADSRGDFWSWYETFNKPVLLYLSLHDAMYRIMCSPLIFH